MELPETRDRPATVKDIAERIVRLAEGLSVREFLDASALAGGVIIKQVYRGPGVGIATDSYIELFRRTVNRS